MWAVKTYSSDSPQTAIIIGESWAAIRQEAYRGEPTHPLLFTSRKLCREWCKRRTAKAKESMSTVKWRFVPVRVRYTLHLQSMIP